MTINEISDEFDVLLNSYSILSLFGLDYSLSSITLNEYEKSAFLTLSYTQIVKELYSGKYTNQSFETSEELRRSLEFLVTTKKFTEDLKLESNDYLQDSKYLHTIYNLDNKCLYIVYEQVNWGSEDSCLVSQVADVYPVTHDEFLRVRSNPFRGPNNKRVLRIDKGNNQIELVSNNTIGTYTIRYVRYPLPIILADLDSGLNIDGYTNKTSDEMFQKFNIIHQDILERAVRLALISKTNTNTRKSE